MQSPRAMSQAFASARTARSSPLAWFPDQGLIFGIQGRGDGFIHYPMTTDLFGGWLGARTAISWPSPAPTVILRLEASRNRASLGGPWFETVSPPISLFPYLDPPGAAARRGRLGAPKTRRIRPDFAGV